MSALVVGPLSRVGEHLPEDARTVALLHTAPVAGYADVVAAACVAAGREVVRHRLADGEAGKTLAEASRAWDTLAAGGVTRSDVVVAVGGGACTDAAGFVAATWLRGIDWIVVPTSTLAVADAAHGGKVALDTSAGKNLVGSFHEPLAVVVDLATLDTLPERELRAGMVEAVKCAWLAGEPVDGPLGEGRDALLLGAARYKRALVAGDLREKGQRVLLNYGHTLGHAVEAASGYRFRHGEAVAIGMVYAAELAVAAGIADPALPRRHRDTLCALGVPVEWEGSWETLAPYLRQDKKRGPSGLRWVLLEREGAPRVVTDTTEAQRRQALERLRPGSGQ